MKIKMGMIGLAAALLFAASANANTMRVVVVETTDVAGYVKGIEQGRELLKRKGSPAQLKVWVARYAGEAAGSVVVSVEYPNIEALAKDDTAMSSDAELRSWLAGLARIRKVVSDSIYEELKP
jgi:hypothetical protein